MGVPHLRVRVAGVQAAGETGAAVVAEPFGAGEQGPADPVQRVAGEPAVAQRVLLDAAADLIDDLVGQPHDVERVHDDLRCVQPGDQRVVVAAVRVL